MITQSFCLYSKLLSPLLLPISLNTRGLIKDRQRKLAGLMPIRDEFSLASCHLENNRIFHLEMTQNFICIHGDYYFQLVRGHSLLP